MPADGARDYLVLRLVRVPGRKVLQQRAVPPEHLVAVPGTGTPSSCTSSVCMYMYFRNDLSPALEQEVSNFLGHPEDIRLLMRVPEVSTQAGMAVHGRWTERTPVKRTTTVV